MKTGGFRDQISTKTHAAISLKKCAFKSFFPKCFFKCGPRVHRPPRFWATDQRKFAWHFACRKYAFWRSCLPRKESHTALNSIFRLTHVLCQEWSCRYFLRHETKNWSHFTLSCCYTAGIPTTLFLIWGKPSCFLYETVSCLLKGDPMFRFKIFFCKTKFLKILRTCWYMTWGIFVNISSFISSIKYLYGSHLRQKTPHMVHMG